MAPAKRALNKKLLMKLGAVGTLFIVLGLLALRGVDLRYWMDTTFDVIRGAGPWAFFAAMAVLPVFGFPLSLFTLSAGPAFGPVMGVPAVIALTCMAIAANVMLTYSLARWLLHPILAKIFVRLGYRMPRLNADNHWEVSILLRVTPGPPFFVQSYLLGLGGVPVRIYLIVSLAVVWSQAAAIVIFGDALLHGRGGMALFGLGLLAAAGVGIHLLRKHYARKKVAAAATLAL